LASGTSNIALKKLTLKGANQKPKLLDQVRDFIRLKHYSIRTEEAYISWIQPVRYYEKILLPICTPIT